MKKALVVYFTYTNDNTKRIAERAQKSLNADIAAIETKVPYPRDYNHCCGYACMVVHHGTCG